VLTDGQRRTFVDQMWMADRAALCRINGDSVSSNWLDEILLVAGMNESMLQQIHATRSLADVDTWIPGYLSPVASSYISILHLNKLEIRGADHYDQPAGCLGTAPLSSLLILSHSSVTESIK